MGILLEGERDGLLSSEDGHIDYLERVELGVTDAEAQIDEIAASIYRFDALVSYIDSAVSVIKGALKGGEVQMRKVRSELANVEDALKQLDAGTLE